MSFLDTQQDSLRGPDIPIFFFFFVLMYYISVLEAVFFIF